MWCLVIKAKKGDKQAFRSLYDEHIGRVTRQSGSKFNKGLKMNINTKSTFLHTFMAPLGAKVLLTTALLSIATTAFAG